MATNADALAGLDIETTDPVVDTTDVADTDAVDTDVDAANTTDADAATDTDTDTTDTADDAADKGKDKPVSEAAVKSYLKELQAKDPAAAKFMRHEIFENKSFKQVYPTVQEAIAAKDREMQFDTVEAQTEDGTPLTGAEAALQIVQDMQKMDGALNAGERWAIEGIAEQFPQGFVKLVPEALDLMMAKDRPAYNRMMSNVIHNTFESVGFTKTITAAYELLKAGKGPEAAEAMEKALGWMQALAKVAETSGKEDVDPELKAARDEVAATRAEKVTNFKTAVAQDVQSQSNTILEKKLTSIAGFNKLSDNQKRRIVQNISNDIAATLGRDKKFQQQRAQFFSTGNKDKALKFLMARMAREIPETADKVWKDLYGVASTRKNAPVAGNGKPAGKVEGELPALLSMPPKEKIDQAKTRQDGIWNGTPPKVWLIGESKPRSFEAPQIKVSL